VDRHGYADETSGSSRRWRGMWLASSTERRRASRSVCGSAWRNSGGAAPPKTRRASGLRLMPRDQHRRAAAHDDITAQSADGGMARAGPRLLAWLV